MDAILSIFNAIVEYVKNNSIDFISMIVGFFVAIEANRWIESQKIKKLKEQLIEDVSIEIKRILSELKKDKDNAIKKQADDKLVLRLKAYNTPVWDGIRNTNQINIISTETSYKEILGFFDILQELNDWEVILTKYILFQDKTVEQSDFEYRSAIIEQIKDLREDTIDKAVNTVNKIEDN